MKKIAVKDKKTLNWDVRGKSSKELKLIVADLKESVSYAKTRHLNDNQQLEKYKGIIKLLKKEIRLLLTEQKRLQYTRTKVDRLEGRLRSRDGRILKQQGEKQQLSKQIREKQREINKLNRELDSKEEKIDEVRRRKARGFTKTVKIPLSTSAKRLERIVDKGVSEKMVNNLEYVTRTAIFLKSSKLTIDNLALLTRCEMLGNVKSRDLGVTYKVLGTLTEQGYLNVSTELKGSTKYWYLSLKGQQLIKDYKNYLSYAKSVLTT